MPRDRVACLSPLSFTTGPCAGGGGVNSSHHARGSEEDDEDDDDDDLDYLLDDPGVRPPSRTYACMSCAFSAVGGGGGSGGGGGGGDCGYFWCWCWYCFCYCYFRCCCSSDVSLALPYCSQYYTPMET